MITNINQDYHLPLMGKTPQNMSQTSHSLLSPTKWFLVRVPKGCEYYICRVLRISSSQYILNFKFSIITHYMSGCLGQQIIMKDGCHKINARWPPKVSTTFIQIWSFPMLCFYHCRHWHHTHYLTYMCTALYAGRPSSKNIPKTVRVLTNHQSNTNCFALQSLDWNRHILIVCNIHFKFEIPLILFRSTLHKQ